jgi:thiamine-phosphate pyrophosphorylase
MAAVDRKFYRAIDANLNRLREALRVSEDIARFVLDSPSLTRDLKETRHTISGLIRSIPGYAKKFISARSVSDDVGRPTPEFEISRRDCADLMSANLQRAKESLRVLEEFFKLIDTKKSQRFKTLRYKLYDIEKKAAKRMASLRGAGQVSCLRRRHP